MWKSIIKRIDQIVSLTAYAFICTLFCLLFSWIGFLIVVLLFIPSIEPFKPQFTSICIILSVLSPVFGIALGYKVRQLDKKREENKKLAEFLRKNQPQLEDNLSKKILRSLH